MAAAHVTPSIATIAVTTACECVGGRCDCERHTTAAAGHLTASDALRSCASTVVLQPPPSRNTMSQSQAVESATQSLCQLAETFVRQELAGNDAVREQPCNSLRTAAHPTPVAAPFQPSARLIAHPCRSHSFTCRCSRARGLERQSHDWEHIARVRALAVSLAAEEGVTDPAAREVVELAALLHDVADWKYSGSETAGVEMARAFLSKQGYPNEKVCDHARHRTIAARWLVISRPLIIAAR